MCLGIASGFFSSDFLAVIFYTFSHTSVHTKMKHVILCVHKKLSQKLSLHYFWCLEVAYRNLSLIQFWTLASMESLDGNHSPWKWLLLLLLFLLLFCVCVLVFSLPDV